MSSSSKHIIKGKFVGSETEELFLSRGKNLKLLKIDANTGKTYNLCELDMNYAICSLTTVLGKSKGKNPSFCFKISLFCFINCRFCTGWICYGVNDDF